MTTRWTPALFGEGLDLARLWNACLGLRGQTLPLGTGGAAFRFDLCAPPAPGESCLSFAVAGRSAPLLLQIRSFPFRDLFGVDLDVADMPGLPDGLRRALQEGLRGHLLAMLPAEFASRLTFAGEGPVPPPGMAAAVPTEWLSVHLSDAKGLGVDLLVGWPRSLIAEHLGQGLGGGASASGPLAAQLTLTADITLGAITVGLDELASIEPGAFVVLAERGARQAAIRVGEVVFAFTDTGDGWRCGGPQPLARHRPRAAFPHRNGVSPMSDETSGEAASEMAVVAPAADFDLGAIPIAIDFDIGRAMLPLSTVAAWQPGQIVDLGLAAPEDGVEVTIRANGDVVGQGDLVRIDDRIAVRITRFVARA